MVLGVTGTVVLVLAIALVLGATVQTMVGLGLGLVAAPVVTLVAPELMPELMLVLAALLPLFTLVGSHAEIDWGGLGWVLAARVPGTVLGVALLAAYSDRAVGIGVGVMVLVAVALSLTRLRVPLRPATLTAAGLLSGLTGTATSIGGPPVALLYQHRSPAQIRSTLAVLFTVGAAMSLLGIWLGGALETRAVLLALLLVPCLLLGSWLGVRLHGVLPDRQVRYAVLAVCAASAVVLLVRSLG